MTKEHTPINDSFSTPSNESARNQLKQFWQLAKTASAEETLDIIRQVLEFPGIYVFGELLVLPNIIELKEGPHAKFYNTLHLFAYGTYKQYRQKADDFLELSPPMQKKLQHLTIVSLAIKNKCIPYEVLQEELEITNIRNLEDVIIDAIYADIIHGKLFQNIRMLEVDYAQGRDIPPGYTRKIAETLQDWMDSCNAVTDSIEEQIKRANDEKAKSVKNKERIEQEIINLKKVLKTQINENEDAMQIDSREQATTSSDVRKKMFKPKVARHTGKSTIDRERERDRERSTSITGSAGGSGSGGGPTTTSTSSTTSWFKSFTQSFEKE